MKILLALSYAPYPVRRGIDRLVVNLIRGLAERHEVILATMALDPEGMDGLRSLEGGNVKVRTIVAPNRRSLIHRALYKVKNTAAAFLSGVPAEILYATPRPFHRLIADTARSEAIDLLLVSYWHHYALPGLIRDVPCVLVTYDIDYLVHAGRLRHIRGGLNRRIAAGDVRARERIEKEAYTRYPAILTVTERDAEAVTELVGGMGRTIRTLPLAIDLGSYRPGHRRRDPHRILFLGALDADFNRDALLFFLEEVFPLVRERCSGASLEVVGGGADRELLSHAGPYVHFLGRVPDIRDHLAGCAVMVLPLRFGGGVRIRMMEAAAMATPVVSTPVGVAGMGLVPGRDYIEAEGAGGLAEALVDSIENRERASEIGRNARLWAERTISMESYPDRLAPLLDELATSRSKSST